MFRKLVMIINLIFFVIKDVCFSYLVINGKFFEIVNEFVYLIDVFNVKWLFWWFILGWDILSDLIKIIIYFDV